MKGRNLRMKACSLLLAIRRRLAGVPEAKMCSEGLLGEKIEEMR